MQDVCNEMCIICPLHSYSSTKLYNYHKIAEANSVKYMSPDGFLGILIFTKSILARALPRPHWGSLRHSPHLLAGREEDTTSPRHFWRLTPDAFHVEASRLRAKAMSIPILLSVDNGHCIRVTITYASHM